MIVERKDFETYSKISNNIRERTNEIFKLLKGIDIGWNEYYDGCTVDGEDLEFKVSGNYRGEYDYDLFPRPLDYLFMTDEEIIDAEEKRLEAEKRANELEKKKEQERLRKKEVKELKELMKKYPDIK